MKRLECPICRGTEGKHKMDCQNRSYVEGEIIDALGEKAGSDMWFSVYIALAAFVAGFAVATAVMC